MTSELTVDINDLECLESVGTDVPYFLYHHKSGIRMPLRGMLWFPEQFLRYVEATQSERVINTYFRAKKEPQVMSKKFKAFVQMLIRNKIISENLADQIRNDEYDNSLNLGSCTLFYRFMEKSECSYALVDNYTLQVIMPSVRNPNHKLWTYEYENQFKIEERTASNE